MRLLLELDFSYLHTLKTDCIRKLPIFSKVRCIEYCSSEFQDYKNIYDIQYVSILTKSYCNAVHYNYHLELLSYCCNPFSVMPKISTYLFRRCCELILINCGITDKALSEFMNILNYFVNVKTIHLDFNKLTFEDCVLPCCTSELFKNLNYFSAQYNSIKDSGAIALAKILKETSTKLKILDLLGNPITEKCVESLGKDFEVLKRRSVHE